MVRRGRVLQSGSGGRGAGCSQLTEDQDNQKALGGPLHPRRTSRSSAERITVATSDPRQPRRFGEEDEHLPVAPISLTLLRLCRRLPLPILGERSAHIVRFLEPSLNIPTHIPLVGPGVDQLALCSLLGHPEPSIRTESKGGAAACALMTAKLFAAALAARSSWPVNRDRTTLPAC